MVTGAVGPGRPWACPPEDCRRHKQYHPRVCRELAYSALIHSACTDVFYRRMLSLHARWDYPELSLEYVLLCAGMSLPVLKSFLASKGVSTVGFVEKQEFIRAALSHLASQGSEPPASE